MSALDRSVELVAPSRSVARRVRTPAPAPGFAGRGHTAVEVLTPTAMRQTDPFVLLMDDRLDFTPGRQVGGAHPHAGIETVTLVLEGEIADRDEGLMSAGDVLWMTAGRGVIHNEEVQARGPVRVLQLWIALPPSFRDVEPRYQIVPLATLPVRREPGVEARLYSGSTGELESPTLNYVPTTLVDFRFEPGARITQTLPAPSNGFLYVVRGSVSVGSAAGAATLLAESEVGFLDRVDDASTQLELTAGAAGAHVVLYAGAPTNSPLVHHGPFVQGSTQELVQAFERYQHGGFARLSSLSPTPARAPRATDADRVTNAG